MSTPTIELTCHARTPTDAARAIEARVARPSAARLALTFVLTGDIGRLRVPPFAAPRIGSDLWRHTCFEAFIMAAGFSAYHELNLAPSGEWAVLAFQRYREPIPDASEDPPRSDPPSPRIAVRATSQRLELDVRLDLDRLAAAYVRAPLRLALSAVVEDAEGARSYWALHHPPGAPDFHHADAFVLTLEPPSVAC